jgi:hypothetical protein
MRQPKQKAGRRRSEQEQKEAPLSLVTAYAKAREISLDESVENASFYL